MRLPRLLRVGLLGRAVVRELSGIRLELSRQNTILERLTVQFAGEAAPEARKASATEVADTGVDFLDGVQAGLVEDFVARTEQATGHTPTDDEIVSYLADERTVELATRLRERSNEVLLRQSERLAELQERSR